MHVTDKIIRNQQTRIADQIRGTDCYSFFNLLTGTKLLEFVDTQLPEHREQMYPPTVALLHGKGSAPFNTNDSSNRQDLNAEMCGSFAVGVPALFVHHFDRRNS